MTSSYLDQYDGLIFDCDGTLADSMPLHYMAWRGTVEPYGLEFPEARFYAMGGVPSNKILEQLCAEQGIDIDVSAVSQQKEQAFLKLLPQLKANEPICRIARAHYRQLPMAVASGGFRHIVTDQLVAIGMGEYFDTIVTAEDTQLHKPEPDVFLEAARRLEVQANRCLVFEDSDIGIAAALAAGMNYVDVRSL